MVVQPLEPEVDHVRGDAEGRLILEYGDYECPYSGRAFREVERVESRLGRQVRFAFRHFPLPEIHPHAVAAATAAEATELRLDVDRFDRDRASAGVLARVRRDVESGIESGEVLGTPTMFIDCIVHRGAYDAASLLEEVTVP